MLHCHSACGGPNSGSTNIAEPALEHAGNGNDGRWTAYDVAEAMVAACDNSQRGREFYVGPKP